MSKGNSYENDLMLLLFNAVAIANIADNAGTSPLTSLFVGLHTADPGEAGNQQTSEANYTGYARIAVARTSGCWTVTNNQATNAAAVTFGLCIACSDTSSTVSICTALSGAGKHLYSACLHAS